ncbi:hypothetical protein EVAR_65008_1 [Eumeta japonica]|uniref:Uncharacterized protein n=1 Tax=Eumeta variegata TaxID=151549 RepID=A0A4C2A1M9_EUMVA|nr:hypothetical protein EVAR_65008_1 [Eumeta japonica]
MKETMNQQYASSSVNGKEEFTSRMPLTTYFVFSLLDKIRRCSRRCRSDFRVIVRGTRMPHARAGNNAPQSIFAQTQTDCRMSETSCKIIEAQCVSCLSSTAIIRPLIENSDISLPLNYPTSVRSPHLSSITPLAPLSPQSTYITLLLSYQIFLSMRLVYPW